MFRVTRACDEMYVSDMGRVSVSTTNLKDSESKVKSHTCTSILAMDPLRPPCCMQVHYHANLRAGSRSEGRDTCLQNVTLTLTLTLTLIGRQARMT